MGVELNKKDNKTKVNSIFGVLVAFVGIIGALWLLLDPKAITGSEFVALSLGFAVIGLIIAFSAEVQEFSIAGNGVRLKELRSEAEKTIEELKQARTELFRFMVQKSIEYSGGWGSESKVDERVEQFVKLFYQVEKFDCVNDLKIDISSALNNLMVAQFNNLSVIHNSSKVINYIFVHSDRPDLLYVALEDKMINKILDGYGDKKPNFSDIKNDVIKGIDAYAQLYKIKVKLDSLEIDNA